MQTTHKATLIGSISVLLWGSLALLTQFTEHVVPPFQLLSMTFAIAFLLMLSKWTIKRENPLHFLKQPKLAWALGIGGLFGYHFAFFLAMSKAPAVEVSLLNYLWPLLIVFFSALLPGESLHYRAIIGALLALMGCWLLVANGEGGFQTQYLEGYFLGVLSALLWSSYSVASRLVKEVPTDAVGWFCLAVALLAWCCHLAWEETVMPQTTKQWMGVIGLGLAPVGLAFFTWDYGVKHGDIQLLGVLAYGAPLISTVLLVVFGGVPATWVLLWACLAIVGGAFIAGWKKRG